jgi:hypothetical protein
VEDKLETSKRKAAARLNDDALAFRNTWKSPELLVVVDSEQFDGWQQLHDSYVNGYPQSNRDGVHPAQTNSSEAAEVGSRTRPYLVVGLLSKLPANGGGNQHNEPPKV